MFSVNLFMAGSGYEEVNELITSSQTWNVPVDLISNVVYVTMIGGGAGGASGNSNSQSYTNGRGGNSGEFVFDRFIDITGHSGSITCTIGAGGAGAISTTSNLLGSPGGDTSFGSYYTVPGGTSRTSDGGGFKGGEGKQYNNYGSSNEGGGEYGGRLGDDNVYNAGGGGGGGGGGILDFSITGGKYHQAYDEPGRGYGFGGGGAAKGNAMSSPRASNGGKGVILIKYLRKHS